MTMFHLTAFPPEILLCTLKYFPLPSLNALRRTSKQWNQYFIENEPYIYRNAAYHHSLISTPEVSLEDAIEQSGAIVAGVASWFEFCRKRYILEANWLGRGTPWCKEFAGDHDDVHRIKVDEKRGIVITTHQDGGLNVRDMDTNEILWGLPRTYVRECAHCEYGEGFLIFDRLGQGKEVWRLASEYGESPAPPDQMQQDVCYTINRYIPTTKGSFKPWAVLTPPEFTRAYRFVYPNLAVVGGSKAYIWDVLTCELVQVVPEIQAIADGQPLGSIGYVELSPLHVLICGSRQLRLFDRKTGALALHIDLLRSSGSITPITFYPMSEPPNTNLSILPLTPKQHTFPRRGLSQFVAVHVSPDGRTIAALTMDTHLLVIKDVLSVIKGQIKLLDPRASFIVSLQNPWSSYRPESIYLAFEHGRIGVITTSGVFIITLDATEHNVVTRDVAEKKRLHDLKPGSSTGRAIAQSPFPYLQCCQVLPFCQRIMLEVITCLQMTKTKMFFTWNPFVMPGRVPGEDEPTEWHAAPVDDGQLEEPGNGWYIAFPPPGAHMAAGADAGAAAQAPQAGPIALEDLPVFPDFGVGGNLAIVACIGFTEAQIDA